MAEEELIPLTLTQHREVGRLVIASRQRKLPQRDVGGKDRTYRPPVRLIALNDRTYNSLESESLPYFRYDKKRTVFTVEQVGSALAGYLAVTINGNRFIVECRRENLDDITGSGLLRATVFPGMWEFDFGTKDVDRIELTVENITAAENTTLCELFDDEDNVIFNGAVIVRREYWVSVPTTSGSPPVVHQPVTDCIPFQTSTVPKGAIGLGVWSWDAGYLVMGWQCRTFSHAVGYVQADDPVGIDGESAEPEVEGGGEGGGGGGPEPVEDPPPP